jgi:ERCC4-type nuclease
VPNIDYFANQVLEDIVELIENKPVTPLTFFGNRRQMTKEETLICMIGQIPGIGETRAKTIIQDFEIKTVKDFHKLTETRFHELKDQKKLEGIGEKTFKLIE